MNTCKQSEQCGTANCCSFFIRLCLAFICGRLQSAASQVTPPQPTHAATCPPCVRVFVRVVVSGRLSLAVNAARLRLDLPKSSTCSNKLSDGSNGNGQLHQVSIIGKKTLGIRSVPRVIEHALRTKHQLGTCSRYCTECLGW
jgi:hypothetical protein